MPLLPQSGDIYGLAQPHGGLFGHMVRFRSHDDEPRLITRTVHLGNISELLDSAPKHKYSIAASGAGVGMDDRESAFTALAEGLERYCTSLFTKEQFIVATANELGTDALDLDQLPRCSQMELSSPQCPLITPSKTAPIRWVKGLSLFDGRMVYLPAVMVFLYTGFMGPAERFWFPITTGCAAHTSYERALLSAICEVIERDAISVVWLQKLCLPKIEIDCQPALLSPYWRTYQQSSHCLKYVFFDATTDIGVPTVYGIQISPDARLTTLVSCSTAMDPVEAVTKVIRDMSACRIALMNPRPAPENWDEFTEAFHGASYMARAEQASAFDFLLQSATTRPLSEIPVLKSGNEQQDLRTVLALLRAKALDAYAVDLSTDEALRSGIFVVRVVIPGLQPLSFHHRARFLGHSRLYVVPERMGGSALTEQEINHWPQPFC